MLSKLRFGVGEDSDINYLGPSSIYFSTLFNTKLRSAVTLQVCYRNRGLDPLENMNSRTRALTRKSVTMVVVACVRASKTITLAAFQYAFDIVIGMFTEVEVLFSPADFFAYFDMANLMTPIFRVTLAWSFPLYGPSLFVPNEIKHSIPYLCPWPDFIPYVVWLQLSPMRHPIFH
ncbi:unnamed protein product [Sphenostylis stenocarpa]|uniref:Uncharacterized protein n=1 Tax=Sphenostylis stenocarpa TaxID=92480 RepID=A0AA86T3L4_9FABA|nr:unnamed protein product [Sphenostylis stenocarpa]